MKGSLLTLAASIVLVVAISTPSLADPASKAYVLRDTTSFPPPASGMARIVVAREYTDQQQRKPEFTFVDRTPIGMLPQAAGVTIEVPAGWHRVWLGRGSDAELWLDATPGERYLIRMRESGDQGSWSADLIRDAREGYADFAIGKGMKLAVATASGLSTLRRHLESGRYDAAGDSAAHARAAAKGTLPFELDEAWYVDLMAAAPEPRDYEQHPGRLTIDATTLRFTRGDQVVLEIPRTAISGVRYGGTRGGNANTWIKVAYTADGAEKGASFTDAEPKTSTASYNRMFAELEKGLASR